MRDERLRDRERVRPAQAHDADAAAAGRRRDGDDGVGGGEHELRTGARDKLACVRGTPAYFRAEIMTVFENASPMLSVVDARDFGDRHVHDAALVRIQRAELLIDARSLRLLGQELRHLPQLDVLALAVLERVDEHALLVVERSAEARCRRCAAAP